MSMFSVRKNNLDGLVNQETDFIRQLQKIEDDINHIIRNFAYHGAGRNRCLRRLKAVNSDINRSKRTMEMMRDALSQGVRKYQDTEKRIGENAKVKAFQYSDISKTEAIVKSGNELPEKDSLYSYIKAILKYNEKFGEDENAGISGAILGYLKNLQEVFEGRSKTDFFDLAESSSKLWTAFYKYLSEQDVTGIFKKKWGKGASAVSWAGSIMGLFSAICDAQEADNSTVFSQWSNAFDILDEGTDVVKDGYEWLRYEDVLNDKGGIHSNAGKYAILAKTIFSTAGQTIKSVEKYGEDGSWSTDDTARTMVEASVAGLETMASGLTFGIISAETFRTSVDEIAQNLENGTTYLAQQSADYIKMHNELLDRWESGSELDQVGVFCEALFKMVFLM